MSEEKGERSPQFIKMQEAILGLIREVTMPPLWLEERLKVPSDYKILVIPDRVWAALVNSINDV